MGVRYDRVNGFDGPRRWSFDADELLLHLNYVGAVVFAVLSTVVILKNR